MIIVSNHIFYFRDVVVKGLILSEIFFFFIEFLLGAFLGHFISFFLRNFSIFFLFVSAISQFSVDLDDFRVTLCLLFSQKFS